MGNEINNNTTPSRDTAQSLDGTVISDTVPASRIQDVAPIIDNVTNNEQGSIPGVVTDQNGVIDATNSVVDTSANSIEAPQQSNGSGFQNPNTLYSNGGAHFAGKGTKRKVIAIIGVIFLLMLVIGGALVTGLFREDNKPTEADSKKTVTSLSNEDLLDVTTDSGIGGASKVSINGPLQVNDNLVVTPSAQPQNAEAGQLYFDQTSRQFAYYDGQAFQTLVSGAAFSQLSDFARATAGTGLALAGGTLTNSGVLSLQGQTGDVAFTSGAGVELDGTNISNTGVLSLQGSSGNVSLTAGTGITLNGLEVTNTGVTALSGTADQISVSAASGSIVLSLPQSIATTAAPTFAGLTITNALGIGSGGTGNTTYNSNGVVYFDGTSFVSTATPASGLCLISNGSGVPEFGSCSGGASVTSLNSLSGGINLIEGAGITIATVGNDIEITSAAAAGVTSLNGLSGALTIANSSQAGSVITINDASTTAKGIAQFATNDFAVTAGNVALGTTVTKQGNTFNGAGQLVLLDSSGFLPALNGSLLSSLNANNITSGTLAVSRGGTGNTSFTTNGVLYGNGTSGVQSTAAGTSGQCLVVNGSNVPVFGTCTGAGGVSSVNTKTGPVSIQGGTALSVDNSGANIILNNTGVTSLAGTTGQISVSGATGAITLSLPQAIGMTSNVTFNQTTLGQNGGTAGKLVLNGSTSNSVSLVAPASPVAGLTFTLPSTAGAANECLRTDGTGQLSFSACVAGGSGGGISGTGSTNQIAKFSAGQVIGNSNISDDGTTVSINSGAAIQGSAGLFIGTSAVAGNLSLSDGSSNNTSLKAGSTATVISFTLPSSVGSSGQCIKTDGAGILSFGNCLNGGSGSGLSSITGSVGGSTAASGAVTINDAATTGSTITINTATNTVKGIASFNSGAFDVAAGAVSIKDDGIALGTKTTGNYVASVAAGNGIQGSGSGEGSTPTISLGALSSNWNQTGAFDIVLGNVNSQLKILANSGGTFYGSVDVGALSADRTFTFPDATGTVCLSTGNCFGSGGGGVSSTGTTGHIALFNGNAYTLADSLITQTTGAISVSGAFSATSLQGDGSAITNLAAGNIQSGTLSVARGGTGVNASTAANGQLLIGNGTGFTLAGLTAGTNVSITNTAGAITIAVPSAGTCSGCASSGDVVSSITGNAPGSAAIKGALALSDSYTNGTTITLNNATTTTKGIASFDAANFDVTSGAVSIKNDGVALGTKTTGNYVATVGPTTGGGITVTGSGEGAAICVGIAVQANKGLEVNADGLSLVDCTANQILKYNGTAWICDTDAAGSAGLSSVGTIDSVAKSANGAVISGSSLILQTADGTNPGLVSTGTQTFAGAKTFSAAASFGAGATVTGTLSATALQGDGSAIASLSASNITTGTLSVARGGTGVDASAAANGRLLIGNGTGFTLASLTAGTGITITPGAGAITIAAPNAGTCSGCANSTDVVNSIIGNFTGSAAIKGALTLSDSFTTGNTITLNNATTTAKGIASFDAANFDVTSGAVSIKNDGIALGTKTTGNYVAGVTGGNGLSVTGTGENAAVSVNLALQANKGLEADINGLSLIDCTTNQTLRYNASNQWVCQSDAAGSVDVNTVGAIDTQAKSANGAVINGSSIYLQTADASNPGLVSTGTQTFAGAKTFSGAALFKNLTDSITAFQIQNSTGTSLLNVDTTNNALAITTATTSIGPNAPSASTYNSFLNTGKNFGALLNGTTSSGTYNLVTGSASTGPSSAILNGGISQARATGANGFGAVSGFTGVAENAATAGNVVNLIGVNAQSINANASTVGGADGVLSQISLQGTGGISAANGVRIRSPSITGSGTIAEARGIYIEAQKVSGVTGSGVGIYQQGSNDINQFNGATTFSALTTATGGLNASGAAVNLNNNSNNATNINTGTSTGVVTIGNSAAGAINLQSGGAITLASPSSIALNAPTISTNGTVLQANNSYSIDMSAAATTTLSVVNTNGTNIANLMVEGGIYTGGTAAGNLRLANDGTLQNVQIGTNGSAKIGTAAGILYTSGDGTIQSLSLTGQNNNCVGLSGTGVVQFQGCSGSGGGATGFNNGGNNFTGTNGGNATIRLTGNSGDTTLGNPYLGLTNLSDLDIITGNVSRIKVTSGGQVQILSASNSTEQFVVRNQSTGNSATTAYALRVDTASDNLGRVGIGLLTGNAPQVRLDIGGNATSTGRTANGGIQIWASGAPGLSVGNGSKGEGMVSSGRIYFDDALGKFRVSENGGGWTDLIQAGGTAPILVGGNNGFNGTGGGGIVKLGNRNANSSHDNTYGLLIGNAQNNGDITSGLKIDYNGNYLFNRPFIDNDQYGFKIEGNGTGSNGVLHVDTRYNVVAIGDISTNSTSSYGALIVGGNGIMSTGGFRTGTGSEQVGIDRDCSYNSGVTLNGMKFEKGILVKANGGCSNNSSDLAEAYNNNDNAQPGELVMMSTDSATTVDRATASKNSSLMGIISTTPSQTLGTFDVPNGKPVALVGRVPTKVSTEGGVIKVGDKITISSVVGVGKKATGRGMVVGTAMEAYSGTGTGSIEVFVNTSYYDPTDGANFQADAATFGDINVSGMTTLKNLTVTGNAVFQGNITVNGHIISGGNTPKVAGQAGTTATVEGTDTAGTITITVTAATPASAVAKVAFSTAYDKAPRVSLTPDNAAAANSKYYTTERAATGFDVGVGETLQPGTYTFNYQVIQ